jgi:hypothetical protein
MKSILTTLIILSICLVFFTPFMQCGQHEEQGSGTRFGTEFYT